MTEQETLLRAIRKNPEDDTVRLAYADWLDERDGPVDCTYCRGRDECPKEDGTFDPAWHCPHCNGRKNGFAQRAEFIRVQVEIAQMEARQAHWHYRDEFYDKVEDSEYAALRQRAHDLFIRYRFDWFEKPIPPLASGPAAYLYEPRTVTGCLSTGRGFISTALLTLTTFFGGQCWRCRGLGEVFSASGADDYYECGACLSDPARPGYGTGRISGIAKKLFELHPVQRLMLTDRAPSFDGHRWFGTDNPDDLNEVNRLPMELYALVSVDPRGTGPYRFPPNTFNPNTYFKTEQDAWDALCDACVKYGRTLAGLEDTT